LKFQRSSFFILLIFNLPAHASEHFGRISLGAYISTETFSSNTDGAPNNDFASGSGRFFLHVTDMGRGRWDSVADVRDKYDSFGKLNSTQQQLDPVNVLQLRSLNVGNFLSESTWNLMAGRFSMIESGGVYTDGFALQKQFSSSFRMGAFGGLNPYTESDQVVGFNSNANDFGAYLAYQPKSSRPERVFQLTESFVVEQFNSDLDREFYYQNCYYQWDTRSRVLAISYLDFLPSTRLHTGTLIWDQKINEKQNSHLTLLNVDAIGYHRTQNIRETLPSSVYEQGRARWDFLWGRASSFTPSVTYGHREFDGLTKTEARVAFNFNDFKDGKYDATFFLGTRKNFISQDSFAGGSWGFYSRRWEVSGDLEVGQENYPNVTLHPITGSLNLSFISNKDLFYVFSGEAAHDENVTILAGFFRITYRFGSKETAPLRDGSPRLGNL
jgi:hypothetical protein